MSAAEIDNDAQVSGLIAFLFACYSAGTPEFDHFRCAAGHVPKRITEKPFVAALPQRLLSHPRGGALAVVAHVERAWTSSVRPGGIGTSRLPFRNFLNRIMKGEPVGRAIRDFNHRSTAASDYLLEARRLRRRRSLAEAASLAAAWIERNDARNYVVLGDPAVRLTTY